MRVCRIAAATLVFFMAWAAVGVSAQPMADSNLLQDVSVRHEGPELWIQLQFRKTPVHFQGPVFFKRSIQMDFPQAYIHPAKQYLETGDERIRQVYVSQFDPQHLRLRLILGPQASHLQERTHVEQEGRVLKIRIGSGARAIPPAMDETTDSLESLLARANRIEASKPASSAPSGIETKTSSGLSRSLKRASSPLPPGKTSVATPSPANGNLYDAPEAPPSLDSLLKKDSTEEVVPAQPLQLKTQKAGILDFDSGLSDGSPDLLSASLKMGYTLILVLGVMFLLFHAFKKFGLRNSVFGGDGKPIKVLSTGFLAPRKSIALVEVAGDVLVIGISNDQISLLGNVNDPERIREIKGSLQKNSPEKTERKERHVTPPSPENVEASTTPKNSKVDFYKKRLVKSGSTNPFGDYVRQFGESESPESQAVRLRNRSGGKHFGKVPVFE